MRNDERVREEDRFESGGPPDGHDPVPMGVDWVLGVLVGVVGAVLTAVGIGMYTEVDQALIAEAVAQENVEVNGLTEPEFVTAASSFVDYFAVGTGLIGLALVVGAVAFVVARRRTRTRVARAGGTTATFWACTAYGAIVTGVISFVLPVVSAVAGGGVAAYISGEGGGARIGAAAGLVGTVLILPWQVVVALGLNAGLGSIGQSPAGVFVAIVALVAGLVWVVLNAGAGAVGGFLADRLD
jgi:hypothetical protein